jgi:hypothetical protein
MAWPHVTSVCVTASPEEAPAITSGKVENTFPYFFVPKVQKGFQHFLVHYMGPMVKRS